jgi:hypothetical protein
VSRARDPASDEQPARAPRSVVPPASTPRRVHSRSGLGSASVEGTDENPSRNVLNPVARSRFSTDDRIRRPYRGHPPFPAVRFHQLPGISPGASFPTEPQRWDPYPAL